MHAQYRENLVLHKNIRMCLRNIIGKDKVITFNMLLNYENE